MIRLKHIMTFRNRCFWHEMKGCIDAVLLYDDQTIPRFRVHHIGDIHSKGFDYFVVSLWHQ